MQALTRSVQMQNILIVDDHEVMARVFKLSLERAGFEVAIAFNGHEAMTLLEERDFDLMVLDYMLPDIDGRELCLRLRASTRWTTLPVILVSAKIFELDVDTLQNELGLVEVFGKPFSPRALVARIRESLAATVESQ